MAKIDQVVEGVLLGEQCQHRVVGHFVVGESVQTLPSSRFIGRRAVNVLKSEELRMINHNQKSE